MPELADKIRDDLFNAIDKDELLLPTLPEVALKVRDLAESPESSIMDLSEIISQDTAMSARMIKVCNSPLFRGSREINSLNMAISRLGMEYTANLAMGLAMEQMFQATSDMIDRRLRAAWQRSTEVAGIAYVLAKHYTDLKPDQATLAGLVYQIGALPILRYVEDNDLQVSNVMLDNIVDELHPTVGTHILKRWGFPSVICPVPAEHVNFNREVPTADYADVVMIANLQNLANTDHPFAQMDWSDISAFARLGLDPNHSMTEDEDLGAEMDAAMALLNQ